MRCLNRNKRQFWYCLFAGSGNEVVDTYGNATGVFPPTYAAPVSMMANISPANGQSNMEMFGSLESYDKVIVTDWMNCPIDEHSVLFVDKEPEFGSNGEPLYDYIVRRVAKSLNYVSIAIGKVKVS